VDEVLDAGPDRPRRSLPRPLRVGLVLGALVLAGGVAVASVVGGSEPDARPATASTVATPPPATVTCAPDATSSNPQPGGEGQGRDRPVSAVVIGTTCAATTLNRLDTTAGKGPWTVVVRRADGSLGRHGAVVTFPVQPPENAPRSPTASAGSVVWPVAGGYARIRGDLGRAALLSIARRTTVVHGRPVVRPPAGTTVIVSEPYRPREVHEVRYGDSRVLGAAGAALGFVYTGVLRGGGFEDQVFAGHPRAAGTVHGSPAVVSTVMGGNATLAWSPQPGVVAYVGYSGSSLDDDAVHALGCLARRTRTLTEAQWRAAAPFVSAQTNDFGER
jgi:hypothetical protein